MNSNILFLTLFLGCIWILLDEFVEGGNKFISQLVDKLA